jgi:hypothetical protein
MASHDGWNKPPSIYYSTVYGFYPLIASGLRLKYRSATSFFTKIPRGAEPRLKKLPTQFPSVILLGPRE